jgi:cytochrome b6-f complex iron-sulfur subunit
VSTSRRGFLRGVAGVGAGAAVTGLAGCAPNLAPAPVANAEKDENGNVRLMVSRYPDLAREGGAITLRIPGEQNLLVTHPGGTRYAVVSSTCTHSGCPLGFEEGEIVCPCHLSRFALDGKVTNPPAKVPLTPYAASFDAATGELLIDFSAGDVDFPAVIGGKLVFPFADFPQLKTPGGRVQGVPRGYGKLLFVFALEDGTYAAVDSICTHQQCPVGYREEQDDLFCPCHESRFTKTGDVTAGPAVQTGNLKKFTATSDGSGVTVSF